MTISSDERSIHLVRRLWREHIVTYKKKLVIAVCCMTVVAMGAAANAAMIKPILDKIFLERQESMLSVIIGAVLIIALVKGAAAYMQDITMRYIGQRIVADLQLRLYKHLLDADLSLIQSHSSGRLVSRFTNDIMAMREAVSTVLTGLVRELLSTVFLLGVMLYQSLVLSFITLVVFPLAVIPILQLGRRMRRIAHKTQEELGNYTAQLDEALAHIKAVKSYQCELFEYKRANVIVENILKLYLKAARTDALSSPIMEALSGIAVALVIAYGGMQVMEGHTTPGSFFAFMAALIMAYKPLKSLTDLNNRLQQGIAAGKRIFSLIDTPPQITDHPSARALVTTQGAVSFQHILFHHPGPKQQNATLHVSELNIPGGQFVALVGPSGGGKSSLVDVLLRLYDIDSGQILIDGQDIAACTITSLRAHIAIVSQEPALFNDTISANISYGCAASSEQIAKAAELAQAAEFIDKLTDGYATMIGQQGHRLSGGPRQRLAIARALLKNAPILILDEATSALDNLTEMAIYDALKHNRQQKTTIVIAHRLSSIVHADSIHVIDGGKVVESGTHDELLARKAAYYRLFTRQKDS